KVIRNIARLYVNTVLMQHTEEDPDEYFDEFGISKEDRDEQFPDWVVDPQQGQWRISDYAITGLFEDAMELLSTSDPTLQMRIVDRVFNRVHMRSDLASLFIEGGSRSLFELEEQPV
ncbi:MAG TPA: hypothetical protein VMW36_04705, partial [Patescibacteria group bacterium]|nr:hypothetical protein [Patescibacteria group bacterium]